MIDRKFIGRMLDPVTVQVEAGQLKFFAQAVGETNPVYFDEAAAQAAGHPALPAPLTFGFSLRLARPDPFAYLEDIGIDLGNALHGEQKFEYHAPIYAGDRVTLQDEIVDIYDKKDGRLEFVTWKTTVTNQRGQCAVVMFHTAVIRNEGGM
jgi:acyl dehydratase